MQKLMGQMRAAMERYEMVKPGDKIAVGVSGGKDSLMLLTGLAKLRAFYPVPFSLIAITADPCFGGQETDFSAIEELCRELDVPYLFDAPDWALLSLKNGKRKIRAACAPDAPGDSSRNGKRKRLHRAGIGAPF